MSSANIENLSLMRKWAASWAGMPRTRMPLAIWPMSSAACWVTPSVVWPGRRDSLFGEDTAEAVEIGWLGEAGQAEGVDVLHRAGKVGVDFEAVEVADHEERQILQGLAVKVQLLVGGGEVFVLALVFPAEVLAHPDVGPALAAIGFTDAAFERVPGATSTIIGASNCKMTAAYRSAGQASSGTRLLPLGRNPRESFFGGGADRWAVVLMGNPR